MLKKSEDAALSIETQAIITVYSKEDLAVVKNSIEIQKNIEGIVRPELRRILYANITGLKLPRLKIQS